MTRAELSEYKGNRFRLFDEGTATHFEQSLIGWNGHNVLRQNLSLAADSYCEMSMRVRGVVSQALAKIVFREKRWPEPKAAAKKLANQSAADDFNSYEYFKRCMREDAIEPAQFIDEKRVGNLSTGSARMFEDKRGKRWLITIKNRDQIVTEEYTEEDSLTPPNNEEKELCLI